MKKLLISFFAVVLSLGVFSQNENKSDKQAIIDSLIQEIYRDTLKFDEKDVIFTQIGRRNVNSYSMFYLVNGAYMYMLDIIPADKVIEFVNEVLDIDKIEDIGVLPKEKAVMLGGVRVQNGIVAIVLNKNARFNPQVAGLEKTGKSGGDNFSKRKDNELKIME